MMRLVRGELARRNEWLGMRERDIQIKNIIIMIIMIIENNKQSDDSYLAHNLYVLSFLTSVKYLQQCYVIYL